MSNFKINDAAHAVYHQRQLEHIKAKMYEVKYRGISFRDAFPMDNSIHPAANAVTYYSWNVVGDAELVGGSAQNMPMVSISSAPTTLPLVRLRCGFEMTYDESLAAQMGGVNVSAEKAKLARLTLERKLNDMAWNGDAAAGILGLLTDPNITTSAVPNGAGGTPAWSTKTPAEILLDVTATGELVSGDTLGIEQPSVLWLPHTQYNYIFNTARSATSDVSIGKWLSENCTFLSGPGSIKKIPELKGAAAGPLDVMVMCDPDAEHFVTNMAQDVTMLPPDNFALGSQVTVTAKFGGLSVQIPKSIRIRTSI